MAATITTPKNTSDMKKEINLNIIPRLNGNFGAYVANTLHNLCRFCLFDQHENHQENWLSFL